ncbi:hypothetical protein Tco_0156886 [Tanacetum coccineum]
MSTPIDFSAYVINNLKIDNLTQENLVGPAFNLLKGTCKIRVELEYHFEECYKAVTDRLEWTNPEGQDYPFNLFDLSKPLPLIEDRVAYDKYIVWGISHWVIKDNGSMDMQATRSKRRSSTLQVREGDFPRLNLGDIEDMLLFKVQKKLSNLERDVIFNLNVALRMFTKRVVILKRVGVESYQKKLNITKPKNFRSDIFSMTPYTAYNNLQGIIYLDKLKRNRLMRSDELYKFCDNKLTSARSVLHDISSSLRMDYLLKKDGVN